MNNKIYEEALASALKRIEVLEDKMSRISLPNDQGYYEPATKVYLGISSPGQLSYIKQLGGKADSSMSKKEASNEIDRLLGEKKVNEAFEKIAEVPEPKEVDTEDAGIGEDDLL